MDNHAYEEAAIPYTPTEVEGSTNKVETVLQTNRSRLMSIAGVEFLGVGLNSLAEPVIIVGVHDTGVVSKLPKTIDGVPVQTQVTGPIDALKQGASRSKR